MDPLVLLHGFTGRGSSWDPVLQALLSCSLPNPVDGWSPDLPGHGSSNLVRPKSFEATVDRLCETIQRRFSRPITLVGYSLGARLSLGIAVTRPKLLRRLVLISSQPGLTLVDERRARADADADLADRLLRDGIESFINFWQSLPLFADQDRLPTEVLVQQTQNRRSNDPEGLAWAVRTLSPGLMPDYRPAIQEWDGCPITLVTGGLDEKFTTINRDLALASPARVEHRVLDATGHNPVLEVPEKVAALIAEVLTESVTAAGSPISTAPPEGSC